MARAGGGAGARRRRWPRPVPGGVLHGPGLVRPPATATRWGQAAYRLLRQVVDEIERRHEGIEIGLKRNRDGTIQLDVRADPTLAKKLTRLEDEVLRLRRQVASAWARIREQNDEIEGLERRRDKLIASIATG